MLECDVGIAGIWVLWRVSERKALGLSSYIRMFGFWVINAVCVTNGEVMSFET